MVSSRATSGEGIVVDYESSKTGDCISEFEMVRRIDKLQANQEAIKERLEQRDAHTEEMFDARFKRLEELIIDLKTSHNTAEKERMKADEKRDIIMEKLGERVGGLETQTAKIEEKSNSTSSMLFKAMGVGGAALFGLASWMFGHVTGRI